MSRGDTTVDFDVTYHALGVRKTTKSSSAAHQNASRSEDADHLLAKLDDDESLSLTEIAYLYESADVSPDELAAYFDDARAPDIEDGRVQSKVTDY